MQLHGNPGKLGKVYRRMTAWTNEIPKSAIVLYDFNLTPTGHLKKTTVEHLKETYSSIREQ